MNVVPRTYHDRISLHSVQQVTRAIAPTGRLRRPGQRPQPARPPRPHRDTAGSCAASRDTTFLGVWYFVLAAGGPAASLDRHIGQPGGGASPPASRASETARLTPDGPGT